MLFNKNKLPSDYKIKNIILTTMHHHQQYANQFWGAKIKKKSWENMPLPNPMCHTLPPSTVHTYIFCVSNCCRHRLIAVCTHMHMLITHTILLIWNQQHGTKRFYTRQGHWSAHTHISFLRTL